MTTIIESHSYSIILENIAYFKAVHADQTLFTMKSGQEVRITCPYKIVKHQLKFDPKPPSTFPIHTIVLEYPTRKSTDVLSHRYGNRDETGRIVEKRS